MSVNRLCTRLGVCLAVVVQLASRGAVVGSERVPESLQVVVKSHCEECHAGNDAAAGLDFTTLPWDLADVKNRTTWITIHDRVASGEMPPEKKLPKATQDKLLTTVRTQLVDTILAEQRTHGRTALRRLNRREFEKSLHELLGVRVPIQHLLPADSRTQRFDTVSETQHVSAVQIEKYLEAIDVALDAAFRLTERPKTINKRFSLKDEKEIRENLDKPEQEVDPISGNKHKHLFRETDNAIVFISHGYSPDNIRQFQPTADGIYRVRISAYAVASGPDPVAMRVYSSDWKTNRLIGYFEMLPDQPRVVELEIPLTVRDHLRINGYNIGVDAQGKSVWNVETVKNWNVPGLAVEWLEIDGPIVEQWPPQRFQELIGSQNIRKLSRSGGWTEQGNIEYELAADDPKRSATDIIERFAQRAFRRPVKPEEVAPYVELAAKQLDGGANLERAVRAALRGILIAPRFLYFEESPGQLDDFSLASRLSYFLWNTMPDKMLLAVAAKNRLHERVVLREQIERMLKSPKSSTFVSSFVGQWLELDQIDATTPDFRLYPEYDELLRRSMVAESEHFFQEMLVHDLPITNAIDSNFVMLDRRLSVHYGIPIEDSVLGRSYGEEFRKVELPPGHYRGGFMTQAGVLKVTANGTLTSPVRRGAWVLRQMLGTPPPPPPPVPAIEPDTRGSTTIRQQLDKHRTSPSCNRCHSRIDPPGFALESFDVIGGARTRYRSVEKGDPPGTKWQGRDIWEYKVAMPVECSGTTHDGKPFVDVREFKRLLASDHEQFAKNMAGLLVTYATGSQISFVDRTAVDEIVRRTNDQGGGLRTMIFEVVESALFRNK